MKAVMFAIAGLDFIVAVGCVAAGDVQNAMLLAVLSALLFRCAMLVQ